MFGWFATLEKIMQDRVIIIEARYDHAVLIDIGREPAKAITEAKE